MSVSVIDLTSAVSNTLPIANGGTNRTTVPAYFHGYVPSDTGSIISGVTNAPITAVTIDTASGFNTSTYTYTVQPGYAGYYQITVKGRCRNFSNNQSSNVNQYYGYMIKNGSGTWAFESDTITNQLYWTGSYCITGIAQLAVGDTIRNAASFAGSGFGFRGVDTSLTLIQLYGV